MKGTEKKKKKGKRDKTIKQNTQKKNEYHKILY